MGGFFDEVVLPTLKKLVEVQALRQQVKRLVMIPSTWGAEISGKQFRTQGGYKPKVLVSEKEEELMMLGGVPGPAEL